MPHSESGVTVPETTTHSWPAAWPRLWQWYLNHSASRLPGCHSRPGCYPKRFSEMDSFTPLHRSRGQGVFLSHFMAENTEG